MSYKIYTDSTANLPIDLIEKYDLEVISLDYIEDGEVHKSYVKGKDSNLKEFYDLLISKKRITTSCVNEDAFVEYFQKDLENGIDILYIGFSSGLSATFNCSLNASKILAEKYPERTIKVVDSLCASLGLGLLVVDACEKKLDGATLQELYDYLEEQKHKTCHLFTVDTLEYLYRGGRVSAGKYYIAKIANIKPTMRVDEQGKLVAYGKVMGRKKSINALVNKLCETIVNPEEQTIFISHGDCLEEAKQTQALIEQKIKVKGFVINYVDAVIGSHSGPGTIAIFYFANNRQV